jgi:serine/threonine protein kinase
MGVVYLAEDVNIGRQVVLKLLKPDLVSDALLEERFRREARACASVNHPNISIIHEVDRHEDVWFICMEFVEGPTLRALLREKTVLPLAEAADDALGTAHERGIARRDMKPENIMLTTSRQVKVIDFGLAVFTGGLFGPLDMGQMETGVERLTSRWMDRPDRTSTPISPQRRRRTTPQVDSMRASAHP